MRTRVFAVAGASAALVVGLLTGQATAQPSLTEQVDSLEVAQEDRSGYDRDAFGDYDRDALLEQNFNAFPSCDGYHSRYDNECYVVDEDTSKEEADDNVDVDHLVALAEAWDSGASEWSASQRDDFAGDMANLALMTSELNQQDKSDRDIAEWTPPHGPSVCRYVETYVGVKVEYELTVDGTEKSTLEDLAADCEGDTGGGGNGGDGSGNGKGDDNHVSDGDSGDNVDEAPKPTPVEEDLAVTG